VLTAFKCSILFGDFVSDEEKNILVFSKTFQLSVIFAGKAKASPSEAPFDV
jgi:hypothetical protein